MEEIVVDVHSELCTMHIEHTGEFESINCWCDHNPIIVIFYIKNKFYLIKYFRCLESGDKYGLYQNWIGQILGKTKIIEHYLIDRYTLDERLIESIKFSRQIKRTLQQVNHVYYNAAGKEFAITTKMNFINELTNDITAEYKNAIEYLKENDYDYLIPELSKLYEANNIYVNDVTICKTVDYFIETIKKQIKNGNNKKS